MSRSSGPLRAGSRLTDSTAHEPALYESDYDNEGFYWIDCSDSESSVLSFMRQTADGDRKVCVVLNLTPIPREFYRIGLPEPGHWVELFNSDSGRFGGSGAEAQSQINATDEKMHGQNFSAQFKLPPLSVVAYIPERMTG